jgi:hypothetical protein
MQIIIVPLLGFFMPVLAVVGLFGALWGCHLTGPDNAGDGSHRAQAEESL